MLRNPVDRWYSAYYYYGCWYVPDPPFPYSPEGFHQSALVSGRGGSARPRVEA